MDRDKLNKAAELHSNVVFNKYPEDVTDNMLEFECNKAFRRGANWLMQQPLQERLTDEEKEKIKEIYWQAAKDWIGIGDARGHCRTCIAIEQIFGKDLFRAK